VTEVADHYRTTRLRITDAVNGRMDGVATDPWTAAQVARGHVRARGRDQHVVSSGRPG
jgi:hypothetical protein